MSTIGNAVTPEKRRAVAAIFWGGLFCGLLDIAAAFVTWAARGVQPVRILQSVASGLLGAAAFQGGTKTAALGAVLHFLIAFIWATVFYVVSRKLAFLTRRPVISGMLYGVVVYVLMYYVVLPLSASRTPAFSVTAVAIAVLTHMFCVGLPISLAVRLYSR